jgi:GcrA cell cycle regulator
VAARTTFDWTDEAIELLRADHNSGLSCSLIAGRLRARFGGPITRCSVIGKIHRLNLATGHQPIARKGSVSKARGPRPHDMAAINQRRKLSGQNVLSFEEYLSRQQAKRAESEAFKDMPEVDVPIGERKGVLDLEAGDCRWPIGDPQKPDFHFCNGKATPGLPYCAQHTARAYQPPRLPDGRQHNRGGALSPAYSLGADGTYVADIRTMELADK